MTLMTEIAQGPWPATMWFPSDGSAVLGGVSLMDIVNRFGTPAYVLDEAEIRMRCRAYRAALPGAEISYAGKAFLCRAMAGWLNTEGLSLDVCSAGELAVARSIGFPAEKITFHGNAKSPRELHLAVEQRVGRIVVDNLDEIHRLAALVPSGYRQKVLIRVIPDVEAGESAAVRTGVERQKFGLSVATGSAGDAVVRVLGQPRLQLVGLHCHIGSQITSVEPYERAARAMVEHMAGVWKTHGIALPQLNIGGGHGIAYRHGDAGLDLEMFARRVTEAVEERAHGLGLPVPRLTVEPGRAIIGTAGITLYRVISVKRGLDRTYVAVDGGMSDNPRPALYGSRYEVRMIGRMSHEGSKEMTVVGHHCEAGDVIAESAPLPADVHPGDVLAVAATGAYNHSMASTYNLSCRPPIVAVSDGRARLLVRRETLEDLMRREVGL
ncbi:diaminopimelate decarboxylase [Planotetraspora thailandica]|uniref:Diaminopimelate decarboxylase n=1 Tax=Planotetraspora thailandica TaxID=487172 RepID=A0A8J3UXQ3_9ACTN|nr:diaminopimelate decarboxylase [Planotetraspora thailandica]GII52540.1 diaminopimelate decarboxylase [Planotetraspora thailandica]